MKTILFVLACIAIYFGSDWILRRAEHFHGQPLAQRELVFFFILLVLGLFSFYIIRVLVPN
jgi:hypothetical protein